ncbi:molybdopterin-dependent oxidoreductase [Shewanella sp. GXUN23E]|uniref:molybdopterin-dependent oxidoreductase n=1 Tax=Shewanella sp. GXUN23E TaxID=3422498 RepID=UPI003D7CAA40
MKRRDFLKLSASCAASATVVGCNSDSASPLLPPISPDTGLPGEVSRLSACIGNCFQTCPLRVYTRDGVITRIESEASGIKGFVDKWDADSASHEIRPCLRGRALKQKVYSADRLKYPMKRVGPRGSEQFIRISWDEAIAEVSARLQHTIDTYGAQSVYLPVATGDYDYQVDGMYAAMRFLHQVTKTKIPFEPIPGFQMEIEASGYMMYHDSYSAAQMQTAANSTFGFADMWGSGNSLLDMKNGTDLMICFGYNPMESRMGGAGSGYDYTNLKRQYGFKSIYIEPRFTDTMVVCDDQWVPIKPGTDAALAEAIAYVWIAEQHEQALDLEFLRSKVFGYDAETATASTPAVSAEESYKGHILGLADNQPKTPEWAEAITGIAADTIRDLADQIAAANKPFFVQGWGIQRQVNGENAARSLFMLPILLGKIGQSGTNFCSQPGAKTYAKPVVMGMETDSLGSSIGSITIGGTEYTIPGYMWLEGIQQPLNSRDHGLRQMLGFEQGYPKEHPLTLKNPIKFIFANACGTVLNQTPDINRTLDILNQAEDLFILSIDHMFGPSAKVADIILPCITNLENSDIVTNKLDHDSGMMSYSYIFEQAIAPMHEAKSTWEICRLLAVAMNVEAGFTELKTQQEWVQWCFEKFANKLPGVFEPGASYESLKGQLPARKLAEENPNFTALRQFREDTSGKVKLGTPSGKIEAYSLKILAREKLEALDMSEVSYLPKYIAAQEGAEDTELAREFPLQLIGFHAKSRVHSTHANYPWLQEANEQTAWLNPLDANRLGVANGRKIRLLSPRGGQMEISARVTPRVMPGVVAMGQGAWYTPNAQGVDTGGNINVLTSRKASPLARGIPANSARVRLELA